MKRRIPVILLSFACFLVMITLILVFPLEDNKSTDTDQGAKDTIYTPDTIIYDDVVSEPVHDGMPEGVSYKKVNSTVIIDTANGSRIVENYPVFEGYSGTDTDTDINYLIKLHREDMMRSYGQGLYKDIGHDTKVVYELENFDVCYADEFFISIVYQGYYTVIGGLSNVDTGKREFKCSLNIDIKNMYIIPSNELIGNFYLLKNAFCNGKMTLEEGNNNLLSHTTYDDMFYQYNAQYKIYPSVYLTKEKIMIIISLTPDIGGYAVFSYNINDAREFLSQDLDAIKELLS